MSYKMTFLGVKIFVIFSLFCLNLKSALRVSRAVSRLTVYRASHIWERSFSHHCFSILSLFVCRMSGARILAPKPLWGGPAQYLKGYSNRSGGVRKVFGLKISFFTFVQQMVAQRYQNTLQFSMFGNMFFESLLASPERLPQGNTCFSMAKMKF